jgi:hypothetical protein
MKLFGIGVISSLLFALAINSRAEAFVFPNVTPDIDAPSYLYPDGVTAFTILKRGETTGGQYTLGTATFKSKTGGLLYQDDDEWFYVESGNLQIIVGEKTYDDPNVIPGVNAPRDILHALNAPAGTLVYAPRNRIHGIRNVSDTPGTFKFIWRPSGFENTFKEPGIIPITDLSNIPTAPADYGFIFAQAAAKNNAFLVPDYSKFGDLVVDETLLSQDNQSDELLALLTQDTKSVPEPSFLVGVLAFATSSAISIWKRKRKSFIKVA